MKTIYLKGKAINKLQEKGLLKRILLLYWKGKYYIERPTNASRLGKCKKCCFNKIKPYCYNVPCITRIGSYYYVENTKFNRLRAYLNL